MMRKFLPLLLLTGCATHVATSPPSRSTLEEVRVALIDVRSAYSQQQMEMHLLEEKVNRLKPSVQNASIETRIQQIEKMLNQIEADLRQLTTHANEVTQTFNQHRTHINNLENELKQQNQQLGEVIKLKSTLNTISQTLSTPSTKSKVHKVSSGETLDKIARRYDTHVETIKRLNGLQNTTIFPGQELKLPE